MLVYLLNCRKYESVKLWDSSAWGVSRVADMELVLLIAHLIRPPGSIPGVGWVRRNQTNRSHAFNSTHVVSNYLYKHFYGFVSYSIYIYNHIAPIALIYDYSISKGSRKFLYTYICIYIYRAYIYISIAKFGCSVAVYCCYINYFL